MRQPLLSLHSLELGLRMNQPEPYNVPVDPRYGSYTAPACVYLTVLCTTRQRCPIVSMFTVPGCMDEQESMSSRAC